MNILLAVITAALGVLIGMFFSFKLKTREKTMSSVLMLIKELSVQICYTNAEIGKILGSAAMNEEYKNLHFVVGYGNFDESKNFHLFWNEGVKKQPYLTLRDRELLYSLGNNLGQTDREGQLQFLAMYEELIKRSCEQAARDYAEKGRMYRSVGLLCGIAVGIMIL